ncbi:MAG: hypothetical protein ACI4TX_04380, partial [Christensenellales bacterium]
MNIKSIKNIGAGLFMLVCMLVSITIAVACKQNVVYADSSNPYLQVTCGFESKSGSGWDWATDESNNGTLTLNEYNGGEIAIGGVNNGNVDIVLVGDNKITVTAPYGNKAINAYNISTLTFKGDGSLTIDFQRTATEQVYMRGIYIDGDSRSKNNGNLVFDENCTVNIKVYGTVAENNGSVDAIYMNSERTNLGNVIVNESATLNIDLKCDRQNKIYGILAVGSIALNGAVDIKMEYTGTGSPSGWSDAYSYSMYNVCSIGKDAKINSVCPGSSGTTLVAFPLVANGNAKIDSWTRVLTNEQYFENDDCIVHVSESASYVGFKNYSYSKIETPLTFEDKVEYDVADSVYGGDVVYSLMELSASGGSGEYTFSIVSALDGNKNGVDIVTGESNKNKIYVNPTLRGVNESTEITVKVTDKGGNSKTIIVAIGAVVAPTYTATIDNIDFGTVRVGYGTQDAVSAEIKNTGTGRIWTNGASVTLEGENASAFRLGVDSVPSSLNGGATLNNWWVKPQNGMAVGIYTATIKFTGTPEYYQYGGSSI